MAEFGGNMRGVIVVLDLDHFKKMVREMGWPEYSPNPITGLLSGLVDELIRKHHAVVVYGLDWRRGTEETMLACPSPDMGSLLRDLEAIRRKVEEAGRETGSNATVSIGVAQGPLLRVKPTRSRRELFKTPTQRLAKRALQRAKQRGGNQMVIL
jgi:GGDEF domain-containing protein